MSDPQLTNSLVMISPDHFGFNPQTADSNVFQHQISGTESEIQQQSLAEFNNTVTTLKNKGLNILVLNSPEEIAPDAIFPNNWFSHHSDGKLVIYPMMAQNRRAERQPANLETLLKNNRVKVSEIIDLTADEKLERILEGTGSLVLDRKNKVAFTMESPRTTKMEFDKWCALMGYQGIFFHAYDKEGFAIYHTNVTMSIGREYALICLDSIVDLGERQQVKDKLTSLGKEIIELSVEQIYEYCGNTLQVISGDGSPKIIMSKTALKGFKFEQLEKLRKYGEIISVAIPIIETVGGGSARCMLAEVFLQES